MKKDELIEKYFVVGRDLDGALYYLNKFIRLGYVPSKGKFYLISWDTNPETRQAREITTAQCKSIIKTIEESVLVGE